MSKKKRISFTYNEANDKTNKIVICLSDDAPEERNTIDFKGITFYDKNVSQYFKGDKTTSCGNFNYEFYIFDFDANQNDFFGLSKEDKEIVRSHRIFLYRDDVRVQPYGAPMMTGCKLTERVQKIKLVICSAMIKLLDKLKLLKLAIKI